MILEFYNGEPLMFQVGDDENTTTTILYEALSSAIEVGAKTITVIAVGRDLDRVINVLDVDIVLQKFFGFLCAPPLQYEYIATEGMIDVVQSADELSNNIRTVAYP